MIASVNIVATGNEVLELGKYVFYCHPSSGLEIIDVSVNGSSISYWQEVIDNQYGKVLLDTPLNRGDLIIVIYKTIPRFNYSDNYNEFDPGNFLTEFAPDFE